MTCRDVTTTSQNRHFEFEAAILNPKPAVIQLTMTSPKKYDFCSEKQKAHKSKNYLLLTSEGEKLKKGRK